MDIQYDAIKAMSITRLQIQLRDGSDAPDYGEIRKCIEKAEKEFGSLDEIQKSSLIGELDAIYQTTIGENRTIKGDGAWQPWLRNRDSQGDIKWEYWPRYENLLRSQGKPAKVIASVNDSIDELLGNLGNPACEDPWSRRGLAVGLVQSGKTLHYVGTICKAIDSGYKVIVVLTGFTDALRKQTQERIDEGVTGTRREIHPEKRGEFLETAVGVASFGSVTQKRKVFSYTSHASDLNAVQARTLAPVEEQPKIFVIKKNVTTLRHLLNWAESQSKSKDSDGKFNDRIPLLVIDDESDVGSVDTKAGAIKDSGEIDKEHDPTMINKSVRKLLSLFSQQSYVGYTATPYANILIHSEVETKTDSSDNRLIGDDLFPRDFITCLPTPSNHIGPSVVFGSGAPDDVLKDGLPIIRCIADTEIGEDRSDYWMPRSHRKDHIPLYLGNDTVPDSLRKAVLSFVLVIATRNLRGDGKEHNSMLVHVTRFKDVHKLVSDQLKELRYDLQSRIENGFQDEVVFSELRNLWEEGEESFVSTTKKINAFKHKESHFTNPLHSWEDIKKEIRSALISIEILEVNSANKKEPLDYDKKNNPNGINVIAVGGDKLSRGLTLEGLSVSYFLRNSNMYDTLMQMGRWFGYRPRYTDLCRLFSTEELTENFFEIAQATEELFDEFATMQSLPGNRTPKTYGLKIREVPALMVTSAVKRRHTFERTVNFSGRGVQAIDFLRNKKAVQSNWKAAEKLIAETESRDHKFNVPRGNNSAMWQEVSYDLILRFLDDYKSHGASKVFRTDVLRSYIEKQVSLGYLKSWSIILSGGTKDPVCIGKANVRMNQRRWKTFSDGSIDRLIKEDRFKTPANLSSADEELDLTDQEKIKALQLTRDLWLRLGKRDLKGNPVAEPRKAKSEQVREARDPSRGSMILYPISPDNKKGECPRTPILGIVFSFPKAVLGGAAATYRINYVEKAEEVVF